MAVDVAKTSLANGVRILTGCMPHTRSVSMGVWAEVGARDESASENGLSHFIEHMLFKGTERRSWLQIAKEFDAVGGHTNAFTSMEHTCCHARVLDTHLTTMVDVLTDIFLHSVFDPREVAKERPVILQEIAMAEDVPDEQVFSLSGRNFWGDSPLGRSILGCRENVLGFDDHLLRDAFHRLYQPERIIVVATGRVDHPRFVDLVGPAFERLPAGKPLRPRQTPVGRSGINVHHRDLEQVHLCLGTRGLSLTDPRRYALSLLNTILGGNMSSRLFQEIRENRGLAYCIYSFVASHADTGMFGVYTGTSAADLPEALRVIVDQLERLRTEPVPPDELRHAKEYSKGTLLLSSESVDNQMVSLAQGEFYHRRHIDTEQIIARIEAVTAGDIQQLAADLFEPATLSLTVLGPVDDPTPLAAVLPV